MERESFIEKKNFFFAFSPNLKHRKFQRIELIEFIL